jgi:uncharacterized protein (TIGR00369 family)
LDAIERRIREDFARQDFMKTVGAEIVRFAPGCVEVQVDVHPALLQQDGSVDAGVLSAMADISAGYAAMSLLDPRAEGLTAEFKINFVAPARGPRLVARSRLSRVGRSLAASAADVFSVSGVEETCVATFLGTFAFK